MSYDIVKSIVLEKDKVYLTSADSSLRPLTFSKWEVKTFSDILAKEGKEAVLARIGQNIWDGNYKLYKGTKLCNLFLQAKEALPNELHFSNTDSKAAGEYLASAVIKLELNPSTDLTEDVNSLLSLRNDKDYILEAAKRTGHNFLNYANEELQKDREFALELLKAGKGAAWFDYPKNFASDKAFAMEALKLNGCFYRELEGPLLGDREVILEAFAESDGKKYHEHLPDLIPITSFFDYEANATTPPIDKEFACKLLECCPSLHIYRAKWLLEDRDVALTWCKVGKWIPNDVRYLPPCHAVEKEFLDVLFSRCQEEKSYDKLKKELNDLISRCQDEKLYDRMQKQLDEMETKFGTLNRSYKSLDEQVAEAKIQTENSSKETDVIKEVER